MKIFLNIAVVSILSSQSMITIPFDWGGQFGYINYCGAILWNQDWRSKNLFFDGTWALYPRMYGPEIENGFLNNTIDTLNVKSKPKISSYFKYDQGDYALDNFSLGAEYSIEHRLINLHGFKRTFSGPFNQYANGTYQPLQQTYLISYKSFKGSDYGGISIGHFITYSGFPDYESISLLENRISNANIFWNKTFETFKVKVNIDQFLQRYRTQHSDAVIRGNRFLTRNQYQCEIFYNSNIHNIFSIGYNLNNRNVRVDNNYFNFYWNEIFLTYKWYFIDLRYVIISNNRDYYYGYNFLFQKELGFFRIKLNHLSKYYPIHPYYILGHNILNISMFINKKYNIAELYFDWRSNTSSIKISQIVDDKNFWVNTSLYSYMYQSDFWKHKYLQLSFNHKIKILPNLGLYASYMVQEKDNIYSGDIGSIFTIRLKSSFNLFKNFLKINFNSELNRFGDRGSRLHSSINPIEMVPLLNIYTDLPNYNKDKLNPVNLINASIEANVSSFAISFEWINIMEIILGNLGSDNDNYLTIHPQMPALGGQMNLSIEWHFQD